MEIIQTKGHELTAKQAYFALSAQLSLRVRYGAPINVNENLSYTFAMIEGRHKHKPELRPIGCLIHYPYEGGTWVLTAYVYPSHRNQGVFRQMVDSLEGKLMLNTHTTNERMRTIMDAHGWKETLIQYEREAK